MSNSLQDWTAMDSMVEDLTEEVHYRISIPVYGKPPSIFDVSSTMAPMPKTFWPDKLKRQLLSKAVLAGLHKTFDDHLEWLMSSTAIIQEDGHTLVKTGEGLYEVRRGGSSYAKALPELKDLYGKMVEVGYPSRRADFSGLKLRKPRAYAGWVDRIGVGYLRLNCGNGRYRRMSLEKIAWWAPVSRDSIASGIFHHEYLEVSFLRGRGGRLHMRVIHTGPGENFAVRLPPPEFENTELVAKVDSLEREAAVDALLKNLTETLAERIIEDQLQDHRELMQLKAYIERMSEGLKSS